MIQVVEINLFDDDCSKYQQQQSRYSTVHPRSAVTRAWTYAGAENHMKTFFLIKLLSSLGQSLIFQELPKAS